jgi:hypothetical protein
VLLSKEGNLKIEFGNVGSYLKQATRCSTQCSPRYTPVHNITCNDPINTTHPDAGGGGGHDDDSTSSSSSQGNLSAPPPQEEGAKSAG